MTKSVTILLSVIILGSIPFAFADSNREAKLEFAGTLEETLGHFWALELNLDEKNSKLALVHATHPIAELYETMSNHLKSNPSFDERLQQTLMDLQNKANTDVSRVQAQLAIDEAKEIIAEAREIVVGDKLSEESEFKIQLVNGLLETAKVEYKEAVVDGIIEEMAEFQDGSAFVWRSQQIYQTIQEEIDPIDSARLDGYYTEVWSQFDKSADPADVENWIDAVIYEFEEISGIQSQPSEHEEEILVGLTPLKQLKEGVDPHNVSCKSSHALVFKPSGGPACVKLSSVQKLVNLGWTQ
jgi:hypothetical protein